MKKNQELQDAAKALATKPNTTIEVLRSTLEAAYKTAETAKDAVAKAPANIITGEMEKLVTAEKDAADEIAVVLGAIEGLEALQNKKSADDDKLDHTVQRLRDKVESEGFRVHAVAVKAGNPIDRLIRKSWLTRAKEVF